MKNEDRRYTDQLWRISSLYDVLGKYRASRLLFSLFCTGVMLFGLLSVVATPVEAVALEEVVGQAQGGQPQGIAPTAGVVGLNPQAGWFSGDSNDFSFSMAWADVDGDGDLDLAVGNNGQPNKLYLNEGGTLKADDPLIFGGDDSTTSVAWGDVDDDGDLDLVVGNDGQANTLHLNQNGMLDPNPAWNSGDSDLTSSVAWADVDGDGDLDLMAGNNGQPNKLYLNLGEMLQTNSNNPWTTEEADFTTDVAWADMDRDGDLDLAVGNNGKNRVYLNYGGTLVAFWLSSESEQTTSIAWADLDGDGYLELAVGNLADKNQVYANYNGSLVSGATWLSNEQDFTYHVSWADVDADGDFDLAVGNWRNPNRIYLNENGSLVRDASWSSADSDQSLAIALADVDVDGDLDLAVANAYGPNKVHYNEGAPLTHDSVWLSNDREESWSVAWGDVDDDGDLDLAVGNYDGPNKVYLNDEGTLNTQPTWSSADSDFTTTVAWADVDGDGDLDLAVANNGQANKVYLNEERGLRSTPAWVSDEQDASYSVAWGDADGDGDLDLAVGNAGEPNKLYLNENGTLQSTASWSSGDNDQTLSVAWGDIDGDGHLDLAAGNGDVLRGEPNKVYLNEGGVLDGDNPWASSDNEQTASVAWGDVDRDGDLDLAVGNLGSPNKVYINEGGVLGNPWFSSDSDLTSDVAWGDADGDGDLDLAVANGYFSLDEPNKVYLNHHGQLDADNPWLSSDSQQSWSVAWGDVDFDGDLDLAVGNLGSKNQLFESQRPADLIHFGQGASLVIQLESNAVQTFDQSDQSVTPLAPADFYAIPAIRSGGIIPITYTLFHPDSKAIGQVRGFYSPDGGGQWLEALPTAETQTSHLSSSAYPTATMTNTHLFVWDVLASGFFGQSDNVLFRLEALPNLHPLPNSVPGPFQRPLLSAQTYPFRVRGNQVRVYREQIAEGQEVGNALIYRLPTGESSQAYPIANQAGLPFRTDDHGYLEGRGTLAVSDTLVALLPVSTTESYTLYHTSATPTERGISPHTIQELGVQELVVSADNPLMLFDLAISLEWDARADTAYLTQLERDVQRTSEILYDLTNGQVALGEVQIYQAKEQWISSHVIIHAANHIRPSASMGGIVLTPTHDIISATSMITDAYLPGQVSMGPNWSRFGDPDADLGEDWPRALAHELGHYLLFLPDNYLGIDNDRLIATNCYGSVMTDAYGDEYSEFLTEVGWLGECLQTIAEQTTGRPDWQSIQHFYPWLRSDKQLAGPSTLPLAVTQVAFVEPDAPVSALDAPFFTLRDEPGNPLFVPSGQGQGYLFKNSDTSTPTDDYVVALGSPVGNQMHARGANTGDRLCVYDHSQEMTHLGCQSVGEREGALTLVALPGWQPQIQVSPITTLTMAVTVTQAISNGNLYAQILPSAGLSSTFPLTSTVVQLTPVDAQNPMTFSQLIELPYPTLDGFVRIWVEGSTPAQEAMTQFFLGEGWGANRRGWGANRRGWGANRRGWGANRRGWGAPVASGDGQVTIFNLDDIFADTGTSSLQALSVAPKMPIWLTLVGQAYRFEASDARTRTIAFSYLQSEVPGGQTYEDMLRVYYSPDNGETWQRLETELDSQHNLAATTMPSNEFNTRGEGIYALVSTIAMPPFQAEWNLFGYPVASKRPLKKTLASIEGYYSLIYTYESREREWLLHDEMVMSEQPTYTTFVNDLTELEFGRGYWLYATEAITLYLGLPDNRSRLGSPEQQKSLLQSANGLEFPPTTFYGPVLSINGVNPPVGTPITAMIGDVVCGHSTVQELNGELVYKIQVLSDKGNGCGDQDRMIFFKVGEQELPHRRMWDNRRTWFHTLEAYSFYLPMLK